MPRNRSSKFGNDAKDTAQLASQLAQKATKTELQQVSLSYKESYATLTALQTAYPTGDVYNHTVLADGLIYTYKSNAWVSTGIQANGTGITDKSITLNKLSGLDDVLIPKTLAQNTGAFTAHVADVGTMFQGWALPFLKSKFTGALTRIKVILSVSGASTITMGIANAIANPIVPIVQVQKTLTANGEVIFDTWVDLSKLNDTFFIYFKSDKYVRFSTATQGDYPSIPDGQWYYNASNTWVAGSGFSSYGIADIKVYTDLTFDYTKNSGVPAHAHTMSEITDLKYRNRLYNLSDIYAQWKTGDKFPIAFLGDSTTAGDTTTGFVANQIGTDYINTKAYPYLLEQQCKTYFNNANLRVYNAGFSGTSADSILASLDSIFGTGKPYADAKMVGISYGINDRMRYGTTPTGLTSGFKSAMVNLIKYFFGKGIQPFLVTPQVVIQTKADVATPLNSNLTIQALICQAIKDLANDYNLELIDKNLYTSRFLEFTMQDTKQVMADALHFSDLGHKYEADMHFHLLCKSAYEVKSPIKITTSNPYISGIYSQYDVRKLTAPLNGFSTYILIGNSTDQKVLELYIFNNADRPLTLKAYVETPLFMYCKVNGGANVSLNALEVTVGELEIGLHKVELWSGTSSIDFCGFKLV